MNPAVSVVVLSFNRPGMLREALASVLAQTHRPAEVIVVDNRSPASAEVARVVAGFPGVELVANPANLGFTGGMNLGLRRAAGEFVLLTEDDIVLDPAAITELVRHAAANPGAGLAGGLILNKTAGTVRCAGGTIRYDSTPRLDLHGVGEPDDGRYAAPFAVGFLPGAFLFARKAVWDALGGFRDDFVLYEEDVELCLRARRAGAALSVVPAARVWHFEPAGGPRPGWVEDLAVRNLVRVYLLHAPAGTLARFLARFYGPGLLRAALTDPRRAWAVLRTLFAPPLNVFRLLRDRRRMNRLRLP